MRLIKFFIYLTRFICGYVVFLITGKTPMSSYYAMRQLSCMTNRRINDIAAFFIRIFRPIKRKKIYSGILGQLHAEDIKKIVTELDRNGYYIFEKRLSEDVVKRITEYATSTPVQHAGYGNNSSETLHPFDSKRAQFPTLMFSYEDILRCQEIQKLLFDETIMAVAQEYLRCRPYLDLIALWWSVPYTRHLSEAAQLFHFDMDRIKFIKFFFYLTDVSSETGPHCFVKGSHRYIPKPLMVDRRLSDDEVLEYFSRDDIVEIYGKKGTIIAADTIGLHKGKPLTSGERLILQFEFAISMFGQYYVPPNENLIIPEVAEIYRQNKKVYGQFFFNAKKRKA